MPTIGELLAELRAGSMNPAGSGDSPYGGINPGTDSPIAVPGIDDLSDEARLAQNDFLSQKTEGLDRLSEKNKFPINQLAIPTILTDPSTGHPGPLTTIATTQKAFVAPALGGPEEENQVRDGFEILKRLGFFEDLDGSDGPEYDKNAQTDGHYLLNKEEVITKVSGVLASSRFSAVGTAAATHPDSPRATNVDLPSHDFIEPATGVQSDHPMLNKIKDIANFTLNTGKRPMEAFPDAYLAPALDPGDTGGAHGKGANINYRTLTFETGIDPSTGKPDSVQILGTDGESEGVMNTPDYPFGIDHNTTAAAEISSEMDTVFDALTPALDLLSGLIGLFGYSGVYSNQAHNPSTLASGLRFGFGNYPTPSEIDFSTGNTTSPSTWSAANVGYRFLATLGIPIPRHFITAAGTGDMIRRMVQMGMVNIQEQLQNDASSSTFWRAFVRRIQRLTRPENNFGLPTIPSTPMDQLPNNMQFMTEFRDCTAMQFIRAMATIAENLASSGVDGTGTGNQPYRFSTIRNLNSLKNSATNRHAAGRMHSIPGMPSAHRGNGLAARNIPSMMLLPAAFALGKTVFTAGGASTSITLRKNKETNPVFETLLNSVASPGLSSSPASHNALISKVGTPVSTVNGNRFSREEVEAIENMLEAEHVPFYFHDLRTNEIVSFHAFLNTLSDSFSPQYNASSGFGRIEDVQIYSKTQRAIQVDFSLLSMGKEDMREMYWKMNKLIAMVYPQFSRGTMLEHNGQDGVTRFVQPFSQVTTATPVIRLRVGDLIKSNYSREGIARLMGVSDPDFAILEPGPDVPIDTPLPCTDAVSNIIDFTSAVPLDTLGNWNGEGWPIGATVILDPPYDPLVDLQEDGTVGSDTSATIVGGNIGVKILSYHAFTNPLGGTSPNSEEIVIKVELVPSAPPPFFPTQNRIATRNSTGDAITTAYLSYRDINTELSADLICHGINVGLFPAGVTSTPGFAPATPATTAQIDAMRMRLFGDKNPIMRSFETTAGRGLAGVITSLNFDWGLNDTINWDTENFGYKAPKGCKISISFTPIHDIAPGLDSDGMLRAPVFNVAGSSPHSDEDVHPTGLGARVNTHTAQEGQRGEEN